MKQGTGQAVRQAMEQVGTPPSRAEAIERVVSATPPRHSRRMARQAVSV
jgi:hypothetical protein